MAKKNYEEMSEQILTLVGGAGNISQFTHCVTRLRFNVRDKSTVQSEAIGEVKGVMGTQWSGEQFQIIIGGEVGDVYKTLCRLGGFREEAAIDENLDGGKRKLTLKTAVPIMLDTLTSILASIIPRRRSNNRIPYP